jgi:competence protein ComEC
MPLKIHFLNVGHGDCTFVELPSGRLMMIDINNSKSLPEDDVEALAASKSMPVWLFKRAGSFSGTRSWEDYYRSLLVDPVDYYRENFDGQSIFRYVQTHPDMDHMGGLHRFFWQEGIPLENFWDVPHTKDMTEDDWEHSPYSELDWLVYRMLRDGTGPNGSTHKVLTKFRGATGDFWTPDGIEVLSPTPALVDDCNACDKHNDSSYVLKITYGGRRVILPGDAQAASWQSMLDDLGADALDCDLLKAAHHGRMSGYHEDAYEAMDPNVVICSVGKKPSTDASDEYAASGARVLSTRSNGSIVATIWSDGEMWIENTNGERLTTVSPIAA